MNRGNKTFLLLIFQPETKPFSIPDVFHVFQLLPAWSSLWTCPFQGGEYGTDEEEDEDEEASPPYPNAIEVFDLAENEDMSPLETDPEKLAHKYKEVRHKYFKWNI